MNGETTNDDIMNDIADEACKNNRLPSHCTAKSPRGAENCIDSYSHYQAAAVNSNGTGSSSGQSCGLVRVGLFSCTLKSLKREKSACPALTPTLKGTTSITTTVMWANHDLVLSRPMCVSKLTLLAEWVRTSLTLDRL